MTKVAGTVLCAVTFKTDPVVATLPERSPPHFRRLIFASLFFVMLVSTAHAQRNRTIAEVPDSEIPNLTSVVAPAARCAAVSDSFGWLAVGHRPGTTPQVSLFRLDAQGIPAEAPPVGITLPRPDGLAAHPNYPLGVAFHPTFPLLYVWQDIDGPKRLEPNDHVRYQEFDHLLIYSLEQPEPKLLIAFARGAGFVYGMDRGTIVLNAQATRLFLPNLVTKSMSYKSPEMGVGFFLLDASGLPKLEEADVAQAATPAAPVAILDPAAAAAARAAKLDAIQKAKAAGQPVVPQLITTGPSNVYGDAPPTGLGFAEATENVIISGWTIGPLCWDLADRRSHLATYYSEPYLSYRHQLAGHPTLPVIFLAARGYANVSRWEHADGHISLLPQYYVLEGTTLHSYPVVLTKRKQVAFGGVNKVHLLGLTDTGRFKPERTQAVVVNPMVEALVYSDKFDRLYVPTEKKP